MDYNYNLKAKTQYIAGIIVKSGKGVLPKKDKQVIENSSWGKELISKGVLEISEKPVKQKKTLEDNIEIDE